MRKTLNVDLVRLRQLDIGQSLNEVTKFHVALVRAAGNAKLCELYRALTNSLIRYQRIAAIIPDRMELSVEEHGRILDAFCRGRFDEAKELVRKHIEAFRPKTLQESDLSSLERAGQQRG
jgi:DNA-binding GntR family transcriptional regulator